MVVVEPGSVLDLNNRMRNRERRNRSDTRMEVKKRIFVSSVLDGSLQLSGKNWIDRIYLYVCQ